MASTAGAGPSTGWTALQTAQSGGLRVGRAVEAVLEAERDRLFLWAPVALGAGIAAWLLLDGPWHWTAAMLAGLALAAAGVAAGSASRAGRALTIAGLLFAAGCALIWARAERLSAPVLARPAVVTLTGRVDSVQALAARDALRLVVASETAGLPPRVRLNLPDDDAMASRLTPGARIRVRARLMPPAEAMLPGAYDFSRAAWFMEIGASGRAIGPVELLVPGDARAAPRERLSAHIREALPGSPGGIAAALATGDQGGIAEDDAEAMRRSGLAHLLSVSGLHVTAVVGAMMLATLRLLALSPWLALRVNLRLVAAGAAAAAAVAYTLLAGAEVPTVRACIAALLVLLALALGREAITLRLVAAGALAVLLLWPESLAGPSFQLSFAAVAAIVALHEHPRAHALFARREEGWSRRIGRVMLSLLVTGVVVELALLPIALAHFHRAGLYGALANIVAIPLTTFVIMPLEALALTLDLAGLGAPMWWLAGRALAMLLALAQAVANAPGAIAAVPWVPAGALALMVGGGLWLLLWATRMSWAGIAPMLAGMAWIALTPALDLLVSGDGRHAAIRTGDGGLALLRARSGDYVRDMFGEAGGVDGDLAALDTLAAARCSRDLCLADVSAADGRRWRVLATRSNYFVDMAAMAPLCARADIVVSDRRLPQRCTPRWLKLDRQLLARTGGIAITLAAGTVRTARRPGAQHPWRDPPRVMPARQ